MDTSSFFARYPLSALARFSSIVMVLGGIGALFGGIFGVGWPAGITLDSLGSLFLISAALILRGWRWAPILGAIITGAALIDAVFLNPYPAYHLAHAQEAFPLFIGILAGVVGMALATVANVAAAVTNYHGDGRTALPGWMASLFVGAVCFIISGAIFAGIAQPPVSATANGPGNTSNPTVHLRLSDFSPTAITLPVGSSLRFVEDSAVPHILDYGQWNGKQANTAATPAGLPTLNDRAVNGGSFTIGPFATPGTYHILCIVHPGMQVTVTVTG